MKKRYLVAIIFVGAWLIVGLLNYYQTGSFFQ